MKNIFNSTFLTLVAFALLSSCNPKNEHDISHRIVYAVQNADTYAGSMSDPVTLSLNSDEWDDMLDQFCDYVESGNTVTFYNTDNAQFRGGQSNGMSQKSSTKASNNIKTTDREEMKKWCRKMEEAGLTVVMAYDSGTGTWSGYAYSLPPSMAAQVKVYKSSYNYNGDEMDIILTVDTVLHRMYATSATGGFGVMMHMGINVYNYFNAQQSSYEYNPSWTYMLMQNTFNGSLSDAIHYAIPDAPGYCFSTSSFSMRVLDNQIGSYQMVSEMNFVETAQYETWVCEEPQFSIVMHVDRNTLDTASYTFSGYISFQIEESTGSLPEEFSVLGGPFHINGGGSSSMDGNGESFEIMILSDTDENCSVELVSDDLVIWHMGGRNFIFHRM